jgi:hypothetical protein
MSLSPFAMETPLTEPKDDAFDIAAAFAPLVKLTTTGLPFLQKGLDDSSVVLLATSLLDDFLKFSLVAGFHASATSKTLVARVFEGEGPLSRFSHRITVCTALGIIKGDTRHDLGLVKDIRNIFAHSHTVFHLSDIPKTMSLRVNCPYEIDEPDSSRQKFKCSCVGMIGSLATQSMMYIARGRFIDKNIDGIFEEYELMVREAETPSP